MIHLNYRDGRPIYVQIVDGLRGQIHARILLPGEQLPSVRELAAELAINPNTIQRAYRELEVQGWIATVPGKGCFVCDREVEPDPEQTKLLEEFDALTARLEQQGVSRAALVQRLQQGGKEHA